MSTYEVDLPSSFEVVMLVLVGGEGWRTAAESDTRQLRH